MHLGIVERGFSPMHGGVEYPVLHPQDRIEDLDGFEVWPDSLTQELPQASALGLDPAFGDGIERAIRVKVVVGGYELVAVFRCRCCSTRDQWR